MEVHLEKITNGYVATFKTQDQKIAKLHFAVFEQLAQWLKDNFEAPQMPIVQQ